MKYNKARFWILLFIIPFASALLMWVVTYSIINANLSGSATRWERLPAAPAEVFQLIGVNSDWLFIKTSGGEIYKANLYTCFKTVQDCWQIYAPTEPVKPPSFINCWHDFKVVKPPTNVIQRIDNCEGGSGGVLRTNAVLLSDGKILVWNYAIYDLSSLEFLKVAIYAFFGLIFGALISIFLGFQNKRKYGNMP